MDECKVIENCENYQFERDKCWICEDYSLYIPEDKKILSPAQVQRKEERKAEKARLKASEASKRGKKSKRKGYSGEREVVQLLQKFNIEAERVPLSGSLKGKLSGDVDCIIKGENKKIEVKRRKDGFKELYNILEQDDCHYGFLRADRREWIVVMKFNEFLELAGD